MLDSSFDYFLHFLMFNCLRLIFGQFGQPAWLDIAQAPSSSRSTPDAPDSEEAQAGQPADVGDALTYLRGTVAIGPT